MFGKKDTHVAPNDSRELNGYVGKGMRIEGKVIFDGSVRIDGDVKGEINADGLLIVGEGAVVEGEINVDTTVISGEVKGTVNAKTRVELESPGKVTGDIRTPTLIIGEGVVFEGNCHMEGRTAELRPVEIEKAPAEGR